MRIRSNLIKLALFATGLSGIVAEYTLATLATYFVGDSVFQWTLVVSLMMFSMGLGSRLSRYFSGDLLKIFVGVEFALSLIVGFSSMLVYVLSAYTASIALVIYGLSMCVGLLIGMEIPLAVRINDEFESLRVNISGAMENDYYGSLLGGLFFAFIGLPYWGLTYTPFFLASINFLVAILLFVVLSPQLKQQKRLLSIGFFVFILIISGVIIAKPVVLWGEQLKYKDKVIFQKQTPYQKIVITQWKNDYWLYINGNQQLCSYDEIMYHEPLVHPIMQLVSAAQNVLVLGGGDGCAVREILKYPDVKHICLVDIDSAMTNLGKNNPILYALNKGAFHNPKVEIINQDAFVWLENSKQTWDVIIIDLPDPKTVELSRLYSREFYQICQHHLPKIGAIITQAGSPYYASAAFLCINASMQSAGFSTALMHNQVLTFGEWGWVIGAKGINPNKSLKDILLELQFTNINTTWINNEAMHLMLSFGKQLYVNQNTDSVEINTIQNPALQRYYLKGNWDLY